jgi:hypothetical protein
MGQGISDPDIVVIKQCTDEDMVTYLRIKYTESGNKLLLKAKGRTC